MPERRPSWIVLVGSDGVGKTTVARTIVQLLDARYTHFVPKLNFQRVDDGAGKRSLDPPRSPGFSALVLGMRTIQAWCFYWLHIRPALRRVASMQTAIGSR
jgi:Cdc6-like AAA superfamily ATPase